MPSRPSNKTFTTTLGGALAIVLKKSRVTKNDILDDFATMGIQPPDTYSKQTTVRTGFDAADGHTAMKVTELLLERLRQDGLFESDVAETVADVAKLVGAFDVLGAALSASGEVQWAVREGTALPAPSPNPSHPLPMPSGASSSSALPVATSAAASVAAPPPPLASHHQSLEKVVADVVSLLKRVPFASQSLTKNRRTNQALVPVNDEYDAQDFIFMALRLLFDGVIDEQPTGKTGGGGSNRGDFYLQDHGIMVEAKVAKKKHGVQAIKDEIAADQAAYRDNDSVKALVVVIYDLENAIDDRRILKKHLDGDSKTTSVVVKWDRPHVTLPRKTVQTGSPVAPAVETPSPS